MERAAEKGMSWKDAVAFFRKRKISVKRLDELAQTAYVPSDPAFVSAIEELLEMSSLEISLAMGKIPQEYRESFFSNVSAIADMLTRQQPTTPPHIEPYFSTEQGVLYHGDCLDVMQAQPAESVDLIFADPPFNLGKQYDPGIDDSVSMSAYLNWTYAWLDGCIRMLKPGGLIFVYNIPKWSTYTAAYLGQQLTFWDWIAIDMKFSLPFPRKLYPAHYALVAYAKGVKPMTFNNQRIPMQTCRHCGGELHDYGGYKAKMNPDGVNVSDVWSDIYPVRHRHDKNREYNELSVKLLHRVISMASVPGDTVFDPFGGSGTTYAVAQMTGRKWIGCELGNCEVIKMRLMESRQDEEKLKKVLADNHLFTDEATSLRKKNGFWLCEDVQTKNGSLATQRKKRPPESQQQQMQMSWK